MKIAVNTRLLLHDKLDGIGWFTNETLKRITRSHPEHQFFFLFDRKYSDEFIFSDNITPIIAHPQSRHPYLWYLFFEAGVPVALRKIRPDIFISTDGWLPLHLKTKSIDVIHDLNFEHNPEYLTPIMYRYCHKNFPKFAEAATRLATVSEFTRQDINKLYKIPFEKIDVVYNGSSDYYAPLSQEDQEKTKSQFSNGCDYFLFVGSIHKRKNLDNIFRAFDKFKDTHNNDVKFIVVGNKKWWQGDIEDSYNAMRHKDDVIFLGRLSAEDLSRVMASALALTYVSLFEGFGIPIVEAFNARTAVITASTTSMPEVAGDAAMIVDPYSVDEITCAMAQLYEKPELRLELIEKGYNRRDVFTWDKTADALWKCVEQVLKC
ncbi:MAG: glycosyltransferase family 1 protein [Bacteroidales bacterium]|nr:glycosyltransferase family 1 protein [Bacteroidales bacterium]